MSALRLINTLGNMIPHAGRRFILDRLGAGRYFARISADKVESAQVPGGLVVYFNPVMHGNVVRSGSHEPEMIEALGTHLKLGSVFYDVGANIGVFSLTAASMVGESGRVLAFEPSSHNLPYFQRSLSQPGASIIALHQIALGTSDGTMTFDNRGAMSGRLLEASDQTVAAVSVAVRSIDSLVAEGQPAPDVIKIDVEGGEGAVLEGAAETLVRHRPVVICEMHADNPDGIRRAFAALTQAGYALTTLTGRPISSPPTRTCHVLGTHKR